MREARFSKPLTVALDPIIYDRIKEITDREKCSMADWVRGAIDQALSRQDTDPGKAERRERTRGGE